MKWRFFIDEPSWMLWLLPMLIVAIGISVLDSIIGEILLFIVGTVLLGFGLAGMWTTYNMRVEFQEKMIELYGDLDESHKG